MESSERIVAPAPRPVPEGPIHPGSGRTRLNWRRFFAPLGALALLIVKFGAKLKALLLLLPKIKLFTTVGPMLVSIAAYSLIWGWRFAVGFVRCCWCTSSGMCIQLRREGVKASPRCLHPVPRRRHRARSLGGNALAEARVGLAGPILGWLACAALLPVASAMERPVLRALAFTGFFLNLFNLLPLLPFDGGRAMAAMAPWMWFVGLRGDGRALPSPSRTRSSSCSCCSAGSRPGGAGGNGSRLSRRPTTTCRCTAGCWSPPHSWRSPAYSRSAWPRRTWSGTSATSSLGR